MKLTLQGAAVAVAAVSLLLYSLAMGDIVLYAVSLSTLIALYHDRTMLKRTLDTCTPLEARRTITPSIVAEGGTITVQVDLALPSAECAKQASAVVDEEAPPTLGHAEQGRLTLHLEQARGDGETRLTTAYSLEARTPGKHCYRNLRVYFSSPLSLFVEEEELEAPACVTVLPRQTSSRVVGEAALLTTTAAGGKPEGLYDLAWIRDYQYDDDARRILWKHYARTGRLLVRVDQSTVYPKTLIAFANITPVPIDGVCDAATALRLTATATARLARSGATVYIVACMEGAPATKKVKAGEKGFTAWLAYALDYEAGCQPDTYINAVYREARLQRPSIVYIVAPLPTILALGPRGYSVLLDKLSDLKPKPRLIVTLCRSTAATPWYPWIVAQITGEARKRRLGVILAAY